MRIVLAGTFLLLSAIAQAEPARTIEPADIVALKMVGDPQIAPDGSQVLFTVATPRPEGKTPVQRLWLVPADGSAPAHPFRPEGRSESAPRWSPDGRSVAFLSKPDKDDKAEAQLWLMPASGGTAHPLTEGKGAVLALKWSHDGKRIGFIRREPETKEHEARAKAKNDAVAVDREHSFARLWIYDLASRQAHEVTEPGLNIDDVEWSPDDKRLAIRVTDTPGINDFYYHSRIRLFDPATGQWGTTVTAHSAAAPVRWSPDGTKLAFLELGEGGISTTLTLYDVAGGTAAPFDAEYHGLFEAVAWLPDSSGLVAEGFEATRFAFYRITLATGEKLRLGAADGFIPDFTLSADGRTIAYQAETPDHPDEIWTLGEGKARRLSDTNPQVASWSLGRVEQIHWTSSKDGTEIYGVLVTPPGFVPGTPAKAVVQIHGGPEWAWWSGWLGSWHEWAQMLASHGYVVLLPNPRGSDGQGTGFARAVGSDWGGADYQDILDGVDLLVSQGIADPARLGIGGWSYGGFMSAWAITHGDRFKAAVIGAAPTDLTIMGLTSDCPDFLPGYFGEAWTNRAGYDAHSPLRFVENAKAPALILHGEDDTRVPIRLDEAFYVALERLGRPVEMVRYPREPHWFEEMSHEQDVLTRVLAWYDSKL